MKICSICSEKTSKSNAKYCSACRIELDKKSKHLTGPERENQVSNMINDKEKKWKE